MKTKELFEKTVKLPKLSLTEKSTIEEEVLDWYRMSPVERFVESQKL
jgi:hypothetical protein